MGDLLHPFQHAVAKAGEKSLTPPARLGWFMANRAGSPANLRAGSRCAFGLLKIEWFFCDGISCSSNPPWHFLMTSLKCHLHIRFLRMAAESWARRETGNTGEEKRSFISTVWEGKKEKDKGKYLSQLPLFNSMALALWPSGEHLLLLWEVLGSHWVRMKSKECYRYLFWHEMRWRNCNITLRTW